MIDPKQPIEHLEDPSKFGKLLEILQNFRSDILQLAAKGQSIPYNHGICTFVRDEAWNYKVVPRVWQNWVLNTLTQWQKHSGEFYFPIPHPFLSKDRKHAQDAFYSFHKWHGPYGELRLEALDFLIQVLENRGSK